MKVKNEKTKQKTNKKHTTKTNSKKQTKQMTRQAQPSQINKKQGKVYQKPHIN